MTRPLRRRLAAVTAAATLLAGGAATHAVAATPAPDDQRATVRAVPKTAPGLERALERDLGLSARDARTRLAFQSDAAGTEAALEAASRRRLRGRLGRRRRERPVRRRHGRRRRAHGPRRGRHRGRRRPHAGRPRDVARDARRRARRRPGGAAGLVRRRDAQPRRRRGARGRAGGRRRPGRRRGRARRRGRVRGDDGVPTPADRRRGRQRVHDRRRQPVLRRVRGPGRVRHRRALRLDGRAHVRPGGHVPRVELPGQRLRLGPGRRGQHARRRGEQLRGRPRRGRGCDAGAGRGVRLPVGIDHGLALRHRPGVQRVRHLPAGDRHRAHPHDGVRRAGRLRRLAPRGQPGAGRHVRRLRELQLRRDDVLSAGGRDPLGVRPDARHERRRGRHAAAAGGLQRLRPHVHRVARRGHDGRPAERVVLHGRGRRDAPRVRERSERRRLRPLPPALERVDVGDGRAVDVPGANESVSYSGAAGYYRFVVQAYSGSGAYTLGRRRPDPPAARRARGCRRSRPLPGSSLVLGRVAVRPAAPDRT